jgi:hypothetical protein
MVSASRAPTHALVPLDTWASVGSEARRHSGRVGDPLRTQSDSGRDGWRFRFPCQGAAISGRSRRGALPVSDNLGHAIARAGATALSSKESRGSETGGARNCRLRESGRRSPHDRFHFGRRRTWRHRIGDDAVTPIARCGALPRAVRPAPRWPGTSDGKMPAGEYRSVGAPAQEEVAPVAVELRWRRSGAAARDFVRTICSRGGADRLRPPRGLRHGGER